MIHAADLLADLKRLVKTLQKSILDQLTTQPEAEQLLQRQHRQAVEQGRCGAHFQDWRDERITQAAVAWVLAATFVRFLEDNDLLAQVQLASKDPGGRGADESLRSFFSDKPHADERHFLRHVFETVAALPAAAPLFDQKHNPLWSLDLDPDGGAALLAFWRQRMSDHDQLRYDFTDPSWDTRFLGDLYQDLSEDIRKKYALLQTPDFVEEFILDYSLEPAIQRFGLKGLRMIDPTCGSGHFLLGAFQRLREHYERDHYQLDRLTLVQLSLDAVHGVDLNPYAVAIARFRLTIAALRACDISTLAQAPAFKLHLATGDSLLHGKAVLENIGRQAEMFEEFDRYKHVYDVEDRLNLKEILDQSFHVVVGNPPYITCGDPVLNQAYRQRYTSTHRQYSLGVPFTERFFQLCQRGDKDQEPGYVGIITANSFMKREFGTKLIREFFPSIELTHVIDTSGAYIPGHGTPTVILFGRNRAISAETRPAHPVRAILGIRGEPGTPEDPAQGKVWSEICQSMDKEEPNPFISVEKKSQISFHIHPWSMGGGGQSDVRKCIEQTAVGAGLAAFDIGFFVITGEDNTLIIDLRCAKRLKLEGCRTMVIGEQIRDWSCDSGLNVLWPYDSDNSLMPLERLHYLHKYLWPYRSTLKDRKAFGELIESKGLKWWELREFYRKRLGGFTISFAFVATHNHFVLDRGGKVFNRSAPVIKLPEGASEDDHLQLLGLLNSSTACFWMKQVMSGKHQGDGGEAHADPAYQRFEFDGTKLKRFPVPSLRPLWHTQTLDCLAQKMSALRFEHIFSKYLPDRDLIQSTFVKIERLLGLMVFYQEELDWKCYHLYGLTDECLTLAEDADPVPLEPGQRAFEIVMARAMAAGSLESTWFVRHRSTPMTELLETWPQDYQHLLLRRIQTLEQNPLIKLVEKPEFKRRWARDPFEDQLRQALCTWLQERIEGQDFWRDKRLRSCAQVADLLRNDPDFMSVAALYRQREDFDLTALVEELVLAQAVPALAALRYKDKGLATWAAWCETWALQRREDQIQARTQLDPEQPQWLSPEAAKSLIETEVGSIAVPPKYASSDFRDPSYWRLRGKLDVPREAFISLPGCERDNDPTTVVGLAAWNALERAEALASFHLELREGMGWSAAQLTPVLATLAELIPWLLQWHNAYDANLGTHLGAYYQSFLSEECRELELAPETLATWRPANKAPRKRKSK